MLSTSWQEFAAPVLSIAVAIVQAPCLAAARSDAGAITGFVRDASGAAARLRF